MLCFIILYFTILYYTILYCTLLLVWLLFQEIMRRQNFGTPPDGYFWNVKKYNFNCRNGNGKYCNSDTNGDRSNTVKPSNGAHLPVLQNLSVIERFRYWKVI